MIYLLVALEDEFSSAMMTAPDVTVVYTGVGKINASIHATRVAGQVDCEGIINYGTAGALRHDCIGKLSRVSLVRQRDMDARPLAELGQTPFDPPGLAGDIRLDGAPGVTLSSGDNFVMQPPELSSDLVDMEGYAIAKAARLFSRHLIILKYGSDFADENAMENWSKNCADGARHFLDWFHKNRAALFT